MKKYYIEFLNKNKNFRQDIKYFDSYETALKWGKINISNFCIDFIRCQETY